MERIETYTDYRQFLRDFYEDRKERLPVFSYRYFCIKAGTKSPTLFKEVVEGKRNLTYKTIQAFIKGLGLTPTDAEYFTALVYFNQSRSSEQKKQYLERMRGMRRRVERETIPIDQYNYYSHWYYPVLRELACLIPWGDDYGILARSVSPKIKKSEAREGIEFLLEKGFLKRNEDGSYVQTRPAITSGSEVISLGVRSFNEAMARRGVEAISEFSPNERDIRTVVIGVSQKGYGLIKEEIQEFINRIVRIVDDDKESNMVYNLGIQLFPLSTDKSEGQREAPSDETP